MAVIVLVVLLFAAAGGGGGGAPSPAAAPPPPAGDLGVQPEVVAEHEARWAAQSSVEEDDYAIWDPSPYVGGGGYGAPIPHAKEACCPHLPCCSIFNST